MKSIATGLFLLISVVLTAQRPKLTGFVTEQNSGKKRVVGVIIKASAPARTQNTITGTEGEFTLIFQDMAVGQGISLLAEKKGWQIVNEAEMRTRILENTAVQPFKIILCQTHKLELARKEYYKITDRYITKEYEKQIAAINRSKSGWQQLVKELNERFNMLRKQITEIADSYTRTNLDDLTETEKQAFELFKTGRIEEGIRLRKKMNSAELLQAAIRRGRELDSVITVHTRNLKQLATEYTLVYDFKNAERVYQELADADTTNAENVFTLAIFLQQQNQYEKAIFWNNITLRHTSGSADLIATMQSNIGILYHLTKKYNAAKLAFSIAIDSCKTLLSKFPDEAAALYSKILTNQAALFYDLREFQAWEQAMLEAQSIHQRLAKNNPEAYSEGLANILINIGLLYRTKGLYEKARIAVQNALNLLTKLSVARSDDFQFNVAMANMNLGNLSREEGKLKEALAYFLKASDIMTKLANMNPAAYEPDLANALYNSAIGYQTNIEYKLADSTWSLVLSLIKKLATYNPVVFGTRRALYLRAAGDFYHIKQEFKQAEIYYKESLTLYKEQNMKDGGIYDNELAAAQNSLGLLYQKLDNHQAADSLLLEADALYKRLGKIDSTKYNEAKSDIAFNQAIMNAAAGNYKEAIAKYLRVLETWQRLSVTNSKVYKYKIGVLYLNLSIMYRLNDDYNLAEGPANLAIGIFSELKDTYPAEYAGALESVGDILLFNKNYSVALDTFQQAMKIWNRLSLANKSMYDVKIAINLGYQAEVYKKQDKYADAERLYFESVAILQALAVKSPDSYNSLLAETQSKLRRIYGLRLKIPSFISESFAVIKTYRSLYKQNIGLYGADFCYAVFDLCDFYEVFPAKQIRDVKADLLAEVDSIIQSMPQSEDKTKLLHIRKNHKNN